MSTLFQETEIKGRFSVIILSYKNLDYYSECLDSIFKQNYGDIEIILSDDGSPDFNRDLLVEYISNKKGDNISNIIVYSQKQNVGTVKNINSALRLSSGEYIKLLAIDDILSNENVLFDASKWLDKNEDGIITSNVAICDKNMQRTSVSYNKKQLVLNTISQDDLFKKLCRRNFIDAVGIFEKRNFFEKNGLFDESFYLLEDWPKWLEAALNGTKFLYANFESACYRSDCGVGTSSNKKYLEDKKRVFKKYIAPNKKRLGIFNFLVTKLSFSFRTSYFVRCVYGFFFRKKQK